METVRNNGENGREFALRVIRNAIVHLELEPGCKLDINELAKELGLSRTPVREALQDLAQAQIVEIIPQSGSRVTLVDFDMVEEAVFVRLTLECAMIQRICAMEQAPDFCNMQSNLLLQENSISMGAVDEFKKLDDRFHYMLFENAGCVRTYHTYIGMMVHFDRIREMNVRTVDNGESVMEHRKILEAITRKDPDTACAYLRKHLQRYKADQEIVKQKYAMFMSTNN